jgi:hypothetical protein
MNWLELLGVVLIVETIAEAYLIYKYRFLVRRLFSFVLSLNKRRKAMTPIKEKNGISTWEGYEPPPSILDSQWFRDTVNGANNPPTSERKWTAARAAQDNDFVSAGEVEFKEDTTKQYNRDARGRFAKKDFIAA